MQASLECSVSSRLPAPSQQRCWAHTPCANCHVDSNRWRDDPQRRGSCTRSPAPPPSTSSLRPHKTVRTRRSNLLQVPGPRADEVRVAGSRCMLTHASRSSPRARHRGPLQPFRATEDAERELFSSSAKGSREEFWGTSFFPSDFSCYLLCLS
jgi:hypothetical protein